MHSNKLLFITKTDYNLENVIEKYDPGNDIVWLQLWPSSKTDAVVKKHPNIIIKNSLDYLVNKDHYEIAEKVTNLSGNWWNLLGFDNCESEWHINELKISKIFEYEFEQVLTSLLFNIISINRTIEKIQPDKIIFVEPEDSFIYNGMNYLDVFLKLRLSEFFEKNSISCRHLTVNERQSPITRTYYENIMRLISDPSIFKQRLSRKINYTEIKSDNILISRSDRCLHSLVDLSEYRPSVRFVKDQKNENELIKSKKSLPSDFNELFIENVSLNPFFKKWVAYTGNKFNYLKQLYNENVELISRHSPMIYITVNIANSTEIVKMWAYYKNNIRSVHACEGLGQPDTTLDVVVNSVIHPEIDIERWVSSKNFARKFTRNTKPVKVSGYLDRNISRELRASKFKSINNITFAISIINPAVRRAIVGEDIFEMLESIQDVSSIVSCFPGYILNLKLHPGDRQNIPLYKQQMKKGSKFRISIDGDLNKIIDESALVIIYDTSVGLESLLRRKNVICYNYTRRDTYITSIYDHLNHEPSQGAAMLMATNEIELKICINKLLPYSNNNKPAPSLEYVLENARDGYNAAEVVKNLVG